MNSRFALAIVGLVCIDSSGALAQGTKETAKPATKAPAVQPPKDAKPALPPGMTESDMQACMEAATPGAMHSHLAEAVGVWEGKETMWMTPEAEPAKCDCTATVATLFDGRYTKCEITGDIPGMGPFTGIGLYGYDNVTSKFQATWVDNCSTTIMIGTGELSSDGSTMTWTYSYTCPITKKPTTMREIDRTTGKNTRTMTVYGIDPKSGKEFKMMETNFTRKPGPAPVSSTR